MAKAEIGFSHGAPENRDRTWQKIVNGRTYVFTKARQKGVVLFIIVGGTVSRVR